MNQTAPLNPALSPPLRRRRAGGRGLLYLSLFLLLTPTLISKALFTWYPQLAAVVFSFYDWDGQQQQEFRGFKNYRDAWGDSVFWASFQLTLILLLANAVKMWPSVLTAVVLHRLRSEKSQFVYRVLFVVPMIIPGLVALLIWKSFYEPGQGVLNKLLNATGFMHVLGFLDHAWPAMAAAVTPIRKALIDIPFGSVWGLGLVGLMLMLLKGGYAKPKVSWPVWVMLLAGGLIVWVGAAGSTWLFLLWTTLGFAVPLLVELAGAKHKLVRRVVGRIGVGLFLLAIVLTLTTLIWTKPTGQFVAGQPVWLGNANLVIPAIIFWGFPWIGTVGVLIYLAGLQAIDNSVYEAGQIDGVSSFGRFWHLELPLILTQVRINLVFMTIGTLTDYGLLLLLLGPEGGPKSVGMVPGLYAYRVAFLDARFGYACALGMVMFAIIMVITMIYQRYVRVDK